MKILISNAHIINQDSTTFEDVLVEDGKITKISKNIGIGTDCRTIDASGKYIIPGGIDPHVHMHLDVGCCFSADDFYSGSIAALFGGTTTLIDFVTPYKEQSLVEALELRKKDAAKSYADYSFHVSPIDWHIGIEDEIAECKKNGVNSFKVYLAYLQTIGLGWDIFRNVLRYVAGIGGIVTIHAEMGMEIENLRDKLVAEGKFEPKFHPISRPVEYESQAVKKAIEIAEEENCAIYIVHVSSVGSLRYIEDAQKRGQKVYAETCPQYLLLDDSQYSGEFDETSKYIMSPPLRKKDDQKTLWEGIVKGSIMTIGTDHCPFTKQQKKLGIGDFRKIPNGAGGVEHRLELLYTYGVLEGIISLNKWVEITAANSAKIFGIYPRKGGIIEGSDADIVIWDPDYEKEISVKNHHQNTDINIYDGIKVKGRSEYVFRRGEIMIENGEFNENVNFGKFIIRE